MIYRNDKNINKGQFHALLAGIPLMLVILFFVPIYSRGWLIAVTGYVPFFFAHDRVTDSGGEGNQILWIFYFLHLYAGCATLFAAFRKYKYKIISRWQKVYYRLTALLILCYYLVATLTPLIDNCRYCFYLVGFIHFCFWMWAVIAMISSWSVYLSFRDASNQEVVDIVIIENERGAYRIFLNLCRFWKLKPSPNARRLAVGYGIFLLLLPGLLVWRNFLGNQLYEAVKRDSYSRSRLLLCLGADPNAQVWEDYDGNNPGAEHIALENSVSHNNLALTRLLLRWGAKVESPDAPLTSSVLSGNLEMTNLLLAHHIGHINSGLLFDASNYPELFEMILARGADINATGEKNGTPLMAAVGNGDKKAVLYLFAHGADINARDHDGWTAIMMAAYTKQSEMVRFLLKRGADPTVHCTENSGTQLSAEQSKQIIDSILRTDKVKTSELHSK